MVGVKAEAWICTWMNGKGAKTKPFTPCPFFSHASGMALGMTVGQCVGQLVGLKF